MTSLQGKFRATYQELINVFGEPTWTEPSADDKVNTEWEFNDDEIGPITIYDWKDYDGGARSRSGESYEWHVGGKCLMALFYVNDKMEQSRSCLL